MAALPYPLGANVQVIGDNKLPRSRMSTLPEDFTSSEPHRIRSASSAVAKRFLPCGDALQPKPAPLRVIASARSA